MITKFRLFLHVLVTLSMIFLVIFALDYAAGFRSNINDSPKPVLSSVAKIIYAQPQQNVGSEGSAVAIGHSWDQNGNSYTILITCDHVIDGAKYVSVWQDGKIIDGKAKILYASKEDDLALVKVYYYMPQVKLDYKPIADGDKQLVVGAPLNKNIVATEGYFGGIALHTGDLQGSAFAIMGNSGGGAFTFINGKWILAGILQEIDIAPINAHDRVPVPNVDFSIPMSTVKAFLSDSKITMQFKHN